MKLANFSRHSEPLWHQLVSADSLPLPFSSRSHELKIIYFWVFVSGMASTVTDFSSIESD
jgi:hypothetical protein